MPLSLNKMTGYNEPEKTDFDFSVSRRDMPRNCARIPVVTSRFWVMWG